ncbi:LysR substrate-binding domain-containing protein [Leucobacter denitrificans]|uniref:LysR substrate-binding domain-containing protein n=1 Tax=Leucobacter denitrificans TaxID=683042 RepID=UPI001FE9B70A|nr:LysR substrate-binding domain-containing protein [Leucobacter denitrificans]
MSEQSPIRLGFTRGISPSKWAQRWKRAVPERALELIPFERPYGLATRGDAATADMQLARYAPGERPAQMDDHGNRTHHAILLYEESIALVLPHDHELAEQTEIHEGDLALITIIDHPNHAPGWPAAKPWENPEWKPKHLPAALELVATGAGGLLAPLPLARHLSNKRDHALLQLVSDAPIAGTTIWAVWGVDRDSPYLQQLAGIMRGRTANSSRRLREDESGGTVKREPEQKFRQPQAKKKQPLKPNSRGAQLAAAREKAERAKAAKRKAKKRR